MILPVHSVAVHSASLGRGSGSIHLDNLGCSEEESSLLDCTYSHTSNCEHNQDVGIRCQNMGN